MKLLYQTHSPFARKVLVFAYEAGLEESIDVVHHETSPTNRNDNVFSLNPLGKVPILITNDGGTIFDSRVICHYLDQEHTNERLIPGDKQALFKALKLEAIADGLSEAGILARWESVRRPEELRYQPFYEGQLMKVTEGYKYIEDNISLENEKNITIGDIALATALSWLEFRGFPSFQKSCPRLYDWYQHFSERKSMQATVLTGDTHD
jgi:glutathione S-transferase